MIYDALLGIAGYCDYHRTNGLYLPLILDYDNNICPACRNISIKKVLLEKNNKNKQIDICTLIEIKL